MSGTIVVEPAPDEVAVTLSAFDFREELDGSPATTSVSRDFTLEMTSGGSVLAAGVELPSGALLTRIEIEGCRAGNDSGFSTTLFRCPALSASCISLGNTPSFGAAGCSTISNVLAAHSVDDVQNTYVVRVQLGAFDGSANFRAVRVFYKRQVAPAPSAATFDDVGPSSLYFQYVEALALVGATTGCGGNDFCPDNPVTRAQLALILAKLMGLNPN
jgi:hypothetical protein